MFLVLGAWLIKVERRVRRRGLALWQSTRGGLLFPRKWVGLLF
jgi:hypothetical protein